jgi:hypothetical protein
MIKAAELQGVLGRKLFSIELKPQIFIRFSRSRGKVGAGLCHWADQGGLLLGGIVQGKARAAAKLAGGSGSRMGPVERCAGGLVNGRHQGRGA